MFEKYMIGSKIRKFRIITYLLCLGLSIYIIYCKFEYINIYLKSNVNVFKQAESYDSNDVYIPYMCQTNLFRTEKLFNTSRYVQGYHRKVTRECYKDSNPIKYILTLHNISGTLDDNLEKSMFDDCPVKNCLLTRNRNLKPINQFDAIIFDLDRYENIASRSYNQNYIFLNLETPFSTNYYMYRTPHFFNLSMCYRRDCDIQYPYGIIKKEATEYVLPTVEKIKEKTKLVAWMVSNCNTMRLEYVEELKKHIPIDIYGACGSLKCENNLKETKDHQNNPCYKMFENNYMFYLSFEDAMCYDYATEKIFNILHYNTIPVVLGEVDYDSIVPKNSVIKVGDFQSPQALAKYLIEVSQDPKLYLSYLEWKKNYIILNEPYRIRLAFCQLCDLLHRSFRHTSYPNIEDWQRSKNCYL